MCAVRRARQERSDSAESIMLYVLTVYPAVSWAPRGRAHEFLPARRYASAGLCDSDVSVRLSVCLSVRLSVRHTPVLCLLQSESRIVKCTPSDSPMTLVSGGYDSSKNSQGVTPNNVPNEGGLGFFGDFDQYVVISRKRCILDTKLLWDGNRKPCTSYRMVHVTFDDLE